MKPFALLFLLLCLAGCGVSPRTAPGPGFTLAATPAVITLTDNGAPATFSVTTSATNGFSSSVNVAVTGLPAGVTASPATFTLTPGALQQISLTASTAAAATSLPVTLTGTSGPLSESSALSLTVLPAPLPDFTLAVAPGPIALTDGGPSATLALAATALNGLSGPIAVTLSGLPAGVTAAPASLTLTPGQPSQILLAATTAAAGTIPLTLTATAGSITHIATGTLSITQGLTNAALSTATFDFGGNLVNSTLTRQTTTVTNTGNFPLTLSPTLTGDPSFTRSTAQSCPATLPPGGTCTETIAYAPTAASAPAPQQATLTLNLGNVPPGTPQTLTLTGTSAVLAPGIVTPTSNPQVALYTLTPPFPGSITVNFGPDTTYGRSTWTQSTSAPNTPVSILVAGMLPSTAYHMRAAVQLTSGVTTVDTDHTFTTGLPLLTPTLTVDPPTPGLTPQPGIEELTFLAPLVGVALADLQGNLLWTYALPDNTANLSTIEGVKLLPNGHLLLTICQTLDGSNGIDTRPGVINAIREIDLAGNIIREITAADLNAKLVTAGYSNLSVIQFNHDIVKLPNGHWIVIADDLRSFNNLPGYPGNTNVLGNAVIDLDTNLQPAWVWNDFDHLDVNRHPYLFPDWTHANAIVYSPDDGNLLFSLRHQNWLLKLNYQDGKGSGDILWRFGEGGDFTLVNGVDPTDWPYAQHFPSFFSNNTSGVFSLGFMDNGDDRLYPAGSPCNAPSFPCTQTTIPVYQIDEGVRTATLTSHQLINPSQYNRFGGSTDLLANGNTEFDLCAVGLGAEIYEVTPSTASPAFQTVWHMHSATHVYRGLRLPSPYPGVQW